jgi:hypothetical protein
MEIVPHFIRLHLWVAAAEVDITQLQVLLEVAEAVVVVMSQQLLVAREQSLRASLEVQ